MDNFPYIMFAIAAVFGIWQIMSFSTFLAILASGQAEGKVKCSLVPALFAIAFMVAGFILL